MTVLGASGQVGQWIVQSAKERGLEVRAVWRREPETVPDGVEVAVEPELLDARALRRVVFDADAVLCAVGQRRARPRNPWSKLLSPPDLCRRLARALDAALEDREVPLLLVSAAGVGDSRRAMSPVLRFLFDHSKIGIGYGDLADMEDHLRASGRDCLIVRPTTLTNGAKVECNQVDSFRLWSRVPRRAVASYLVDRALRADWDGFQAEMISA